MRNKELERSFAEFDDLPEDDRSLLALLATSYFSKARANRMAKRIRNTALAALLGFNIYSVIEPNKDDFIIDIALVSPLSLAESRRRETKGQALQDVGIVRRVLNQNSHEIPTWAEEPEVEATFQDNAVFEYVFAKTSKLMSK